MIVYNGTQRAHEIEVRLRQEVTALAQNGIHITIAAILFEEDSGSRLYTRLKAEAAERVGISYQVYRFSLTDEVRIIQEKITQLNADRTITGIIIQKPRRKTWLTNQPKRKTRTDYVTWWNSLTSTVDLAKDVDGLHPQTLRAIKAGNWKEQGSVLPATAAAALIIMEDFATNQAQSLTAYKVSIIGISDLLGRPLFFELKRRGVESELLGRKGLQEKIASGTGLEKSNIIVSATGVEGLITGQMIGEGSALIDVGEPRPDVDINSVISVGKASFLTPVPGGVGPLTIVCLLQNAVALAQS